jgi:cytidylate kinase
VNATWVVAIDGPAGAGKSSASRCLAERLGFDFLDTGAMYRCVTLAVIQAGMDAADSEQVVELASRLQFRLEGTQVFLNGRDVSEEIRSPEVSRVIGKIADNRRVRQLLSQWQREWAQGKHVVTEGRDQGTEVFYDAPCKIFLTASDRTRAERRRQELASKGVQLTLEQVLEQQNLRDAEDRRREVGGLRCADDAVMLVTDGLELNQVVDRMAQIVAEKIPLASTGNARG